MAKAKLFFFISIILLVTGCYSLKIDSRVTSLDHVRLKQHFFILGLIGDKEINLTDQCPRGVAAVREKFEFTDILVTVFTAGIYTPKTVLVNCAS